MTSREYDSAHHTEKRPDRGSIALQHLGYGWTDRNIDRSRTGFGVFAHSEGWDEAWGRTALELGGLITRPPHKTSTVEITVHRRRRVVLRKSPTSGRREGSHLVHLVDADPAVLSTADCVEMLARNILHRDPDEFADHLPTPTMAPLLMSATWPPTPCTACGAPIGAGAHSVDILDATIAALLALDDRRRTPVAMVGAPLDCMMTTIAAAVRVLPPAITDHLRLAGSSGDLADVAAEGPTLLAAETHQHNDTRDLVVIHLDRQVEDVPDDVARYVDLGRRTREWYDRHGPLPTSVRGIPGLSRWLEVRVLLLRRVHELDPTEVETILSMGTDAVPWLRDPDNLTGAVAMALTNRTVLSQLHALREAVEPAQLVNALCRGAYALDSGSVATAILETFGVNETLFAERASEFFLHDLAAGRSVSRTYEGPVFAFLCSDDRLTAGECTPLTEQLLRIPAFRAAAAIGNPTVAARMLTAQLSLPPSERDSGAVAAALAERPSLVTTITASHVHDVDIRDIAWLCDVLSMSDCRDMLLRLSDRLRATDLLRALDLSSRSDEELHRLLWEVWPRVRTEMPIPTRLQPWVDVITPEYGTRPGANLSVEHTETSFDVSTDVFSDDHESVAESAQPGALTRMLRALRLSK